MSDVPLELVCPKCGIEVLPIEAAGIWFCPHCARPFTDREIDEQRQQQRERQTGDGERPPRDEPPGE